MDREEMYVKLVDMLDKIVDKDDEGTLDQETIEEARELSDEAKKL